MGIGECDFRESGLEMGELSLEPDFSTCDSLHSTVVDDFSSTILLFSFSSI